MSLCHIYTYGFGQDLHVLILGCDSFFLACKDQGGWSVYFLQAPRWLWSLMRVAQTLPHFRQGEALGWRHLRGRTFFVPLPFLLGSFHPVLLDLELSCSLGCTHNPQPQCGTRDGIPCYTVKPLLSGPPIKRTPFVLSGYLVWS